MKTFTTVIFPLDTSKAQYWMGEVNENGDITGFRDVTLNPNMSKVVRENVMYYVLVKEEEESGDLNIDCIQWYLATPKDGDPNMSIRAMIDSGIINVAEAANAIMAKHRDLSKKPN